MEIWTAGVNIFQVIVTLVGAVMLIIGIVNYLEGHSSENAASKSTGGKLMVAGGGIILVGQTLVPMLTGMLAV